MTGHLNQEKAAEHIGVSLTKFRQLEADGFINRKPGKGAWYVIADLDAYIGGPTDGQDNNE